MCECTTSIERFGRKDCMQSIVDCIEQNHRTRALYYILKNCNRLQTMEEHSHTSEEISESS